MLFWDRLKYLKETENFGDARKMNGLLLFALDVIREELGSPIIIHAGWEPGTGHAPNSKHYTGNAVDFHITSGSMSYNTGRIIEILNQLGVLNYGLGAYLGYWKYNGQPQDGFHLDLRPEIMYWISTEPQRYSYFKNKDVFTKAISA